jgi:lipopolysaccharide/colanic/teichoic acid biosynthesis glycosyltransferase
LNPYRFRDVVTAGLGLVVLAPVMAVVAGAVAVALGRPVLFCQVRTGRGGTTFTLFKFRSMRSGDGPDEQRLTRFGRLLRASSLDELPSVWNVLCGQMSLVGPRPLLPAYLDRYSAEQSRRHLVRPGITGLAQVRGRNATTWEERFRLDVWYVENRRMWLDFRILLWTVGTVLRRDGISAPGSATMPEFQGQP